MNKIFKSSGNLISWIATPLVAMCPLCVFTAAFIALGQISFLFAIARLLVPILVVLISISLLSFYLSFRSHRNPYPLVLSVIGGVSLIYSNVAFGASILIQVLGIVLLSAAALIDLNLRLNKRRDCEACQGISKAHTH